MRVKIVMKTLFEKQYTHEVILKVDSCPNNDKSVHFFSVLFLVAFKYFYFLNLFLSRKPQDFPENSPFFICLFALCWNSSSKKSFATCP